ncbi:hypothetical protein Pan216_35380 [Planctomycetes bacterium Pan216]|uniref:Uncharacterized protein n=1 Tax=Kolteria novifilia TaxID=2527975 RepID=A0A518B6T7_9BACT|nr:hypothetical protein Pan216_35380 [Planctomycetes bacterium Pan216]
MQTDKLPRQLSQPKPTLETEPSVPICKFVHEISALRSCGGLPNHGRFPHAHGQRGHGTQESFSQ